MQTVVETPAYLSAAKDAGVTEIERSQIVEFLAANPLAGDVMEGAGGARKFRFAGRGKGKSGGYRVISYYANESFPVFLLDIFGKDEKANLSKAERNELNAILTTIADLYRKRRPK